MRLSIGDGLATLCYKDCARIFWQVPCSRRLFWIGHKDCGRGLTRRLWSSATKIGSSIIDRWARRLATDWPHCARRLATDALVDWRRIRHKDCATDALVDWRRIRHKDCVRNFWQVLCSRRLFWMCSSIGDKDCGRQVLFSSILPCSRRLFWIGHKDCARRLATDWPIGDKQDS